MQSCQYDSVSHFSSYDMLLFLFFAFKRIQHQLQAPFVGSRRGWKIMQIYLPMSITAGWTIFLRSPPAYLHLGWLFCTLFFVVFYNTKFTFFTSLLCECLTIIKVVFSRFTLTHQLFYTLKVSQNVHRDWHLISNQVSDVWIHFKNPHGAVAGL